MKRLLLSSAAAVALMAAGAAAQTAPPTTGMDPLLGPLAPPAVPSDAAATGSAMDPGSDHKFSLFAPVTNKNLSGSDVKVIAAALLLEHGNHTWQVSNILSEPNQMIEFSYTSTHGDIIASFDVNTITGEIARVN